MTKGNENGNGRLLQALRNEVAFLNSGGYGKPFRSQWRPTLLLRDSPLCINYCNTGRQNPCSKCPLFALVPPGQEDRLVPCHRIPLNSQGETIADLYQKGSQKLMDDCYRNWLKDKIQELTRS